MAPTSSAPVLSLLHFYRSPTALSSLVVRSCPPALLPSQWVFAKQRKWSKMAFWPQLSCPSSMTWSLPRACRAVPHTFPTSFLFSNILALFPCFLKGAEGLCCALWWGYWNLLECSGTSQGSSTSPHRTPTGPSQNILEPAGTDPVSLQRPLLEPSRRFWNQPRALLRAPSAPLPAPRHRHPTQQLLRQSLQGNQPLMYSGLWALCSILPSALTVDTTNTHPSHWLYAIFTMVSPLLPSPSLLLQSHNQSKWASDNSERYQRDIPQIASQAQKEAGKCHLDKDEPLSGSPSCPWRHSASSSPAPAGCLPSAPSRDFQRDDKNRSVWPQRALPTSFTPPSFSTSILPWHLGSVACFQDFSLWDQFQRKIEIFTFTMDLLHK